eukprot:135889_1
MTLYITDIVLLDHSCHAFGIRWIDLKLKGIILQFMLHLCPIHRFTHNAATKAPLRRGIIAKRERSIAKEEAPQPEEEAPPKKEEEDEEDHQKDEEPQPKEPKVKEKKTKPQRL